MRARCSAVFVFPLRASESADLCASDSLRPRNAAALFSTCSGGLFLPLCASEMRRLVSSLCRRPRDCSDLVAHCSGVNLRPLCALDNFARCSALSGMPVFASDMRRRDSSSMPLAPSPPSVLFASEKPHSCQYRMRIFSSRKASASDSFVATTSIRTSPLCDITFCRTLVWCGFLPSRRQARWPRPFPT